MLSRNAQASEFCVSCVSQDSLFPGNPHVWMGSDSSCTGGALPVTVAAGALMSLTCSRRDEPFSLVPVTAQKSESTPGPPLKDMHLLNPSHGTPHPHPMLVLAGVLGFRDSLSTPSGQQYCCSPGRYRAEGPLALGLESCKSLTQSFSAESCHALSSTHACSPLGQLCSCCLSFPHAGIGHVALRGEATRAAHAVAYALALLASPWLAHMKSTGWHRVCQLSMEGNSRVFRDFCSNRLRTDSSCCAPAPHAG